MLKVMHSFCGVLAAVTRGLPYDMSKVLLCTASSTPRALPLLYSKGLSHQSIYKPYSTYFDKPSILNTVAFILAADLPLYRPAGKQPNALPLFNSLIYYNPSYRYHLRQATPMRATATIQTSGFFVFQHLAAQLLVHQNNNQTRFSFSSHEAEVASRPPPSTILLRKKNPSVAPNQSQTMSTLFTQFSHPIFCDS